MKTLLHLIASYFVGLVAMTVWKHETYDDDCENAVQFTQRIANGEKY